MSSFAHAPWTVGILIAAVFIAALLHMAGVWWFDILLVLGWLGGFIMNFSREMTQAEYYREIPEVGGLRRNMKWWAGARFWRWNAHSKEESVAALLLPIPLAVVAHFIMLDQFGRMALT